ncbi:hypothetical protein AXG93_1154s1850 [Marchantia polymorpha subsp. ruderalis]|uniref:Uncharacterized protein n=1 Tax=Marchantia polymorpha subsp. ruderalis TaxID=1480154 RepID=A0A176WRJ0_MARPO|nr:hypothetical protein AXG93_1154s1850 [Marchantia polymorpha subsp. ruderalis]
MCRSHEKLSVECEAHPKHPSYAYVHSLLPSESTPKWLASASTSTEGIFFDRACSSYNAKLEEFWHDSVAAGAPDAYAGRTVPRRHSFMPSLYSKHRHRIAFARGASGTHCFDEIHFAHFSGSDAVQAHSCLLLLLLNRCELTMSVWLARVDTPSSEASSVCLAASFSLPLFV